MLPRKPLRKERDIRHRAPFLGVMVVEMRFQDLGQDHVTDIVPDMSKRHGYLVTFLSFHGAIKRLPCAHPAARVALQAEV